MLCVVYKSPRKEGTYLYVERRDDFGPVPAALMTTFGKPQLVTVLNLAKREHLGQVDIHKLRSALNTQGFYLQLPPPPENLLAQHKVSIQTDKG